MKAVADKYDKECLEKDVSLVSININDRKENTKKEELPFEILLKKSQKINGLFNGFGQNNEDDAWDLIQVTILKLIERKVFMKLIIRLPLLKQSSGAFIDKYRKDKRMVSVEANSVQH